MMRVASSGFSLNASMLRVMRIIGRTNNELSAKYTSAAAMMDMMTDSHRMFSP